MSDLIDDPKAGLNDPEFTISEISGAIKRLIEGEFSHVRLKGEEPLNNVPRSAKELGHLVAEPILDVNGTASIVIEKV